ncbi:MAG: AAA family ATPase, partial [Pseudomonadota bacterium]
MTIRHCDQDQLKEVLAKRLTPSAHITTPERLFGRERKLTQIERAFNSSGRHIFIYGDRGVGKTSLAVTAAYLHQDTSEEPVYVLCGEDSTFASVLHAVGVNALPLKERMETTGSPMQVSGGIPGIGSGSYQAA